MSFISKNPIEQMEKKPAVKSHARKTKSNKFYGLNRVERANGGKLRDGWLVIVTGVDSEGKQQHLFPVRHFPDADTSAKVGRAAMTESRMAALRYRDEELKKLNKELPKSADIKVRKRKNETKFTRSKTRTDEDMYGISRDLRTNTPSLAGWRVRVKTKDGLKSKHFSDNGNGGQEAALEAAKKWRNDMLAMDNKPAPVSVEMSSLRKLRTDAGISQDLAASWMHVSHLTFARLERGIRTPANAFVKLFEAYATKKLLPLAEPPKINLTDFRMALGKSQKEMSSFISGSTSQAPWSNWETGKTGVPGWVVCFINQIGWPEEGLANHDLKND